MTKTTSLILGIVLIIGVGGLVYLQKNAAPAAESTTPDAYEGITTAIVAEHNSRESCWSSINGNVYDLTAWIPQHPGGEQAILQLCGTDGSAKFNGQHGGAAQQAAVLAGFKIGELAN